MKVSDYVINYLVEKNIHHIFLLSGGGMMHLLDSVGQNEKIESVHNLHEQACAISAEAYAQYTNNYGAVMVTTGPGSTNAITGVASAWIDSIPLVVLSGQVKTADSLTQFGVRQMGPQEVDIVPMISHITKYAMTIKDPKEIKKVLDEAFYLAKEGRPGPVWIDIPLDVQGAQVDTDSLEGFHSPNLKEKSELKIKETFELLERAKRPVLLLGNGVRCGMAEKEVLPFVEKLKIPVLTTWKSLDLIEDDHPLFFGRPGSIGQRTANFIQQTSDLIISVGARLDLNTVGFNYKGFAKGAKKIIVDIDENEIRKMEIPVDLEVVANSKDYLKGVIGSQEGVDRKENWLKICEDWRARFPWIIDEHRKIVPKKVNTYIFTECLSELLTDSDILVPGSSGSCSEIPSQVFRVKKNQRFLNSPGLGSMGFGVAASIGACIASGRKKTICVIGDGGLQHNIQELETMKRMNLPIKLFVLNNNAYAAIRAMQSRHFNGRYIACDPESDLTLPDTMKIAKGYEINCSRIDDQNTVFEDVKKVLDSDGPWICEIMVDENMLTSPKLMSEVKPDGSIESKPLEDLWPYLPREEYKQIMSSLEAT